METHGRSTLSTCSEVSRFYLASPEAIARDADPLNSARPPSSSNPPLDPIMDSASPSPSTSRSGYDMVDMELDAAAALANLAGQTAAGESGKQSVSPAQGDHTRAGLFSSFSAAAADDRETEERFKHCSAMAGSSSVNLSAGRGTRQGLTEAEKEERRIRRVLANRESARQTIRRRQALRDELTKKVAYLRLENDAMRLEKKSAMEEYLSLRQANAQLKEQIADAARGEIDMNSAAAEVESSAFPTTIAFFDQTTTASVRPLHAPPCAWFRPFPSESGAEQIGGESSSVPCRSEAEAEKEARGDSRGKAAAAADARKRRKELTKLKHRHIR